jgi:N-acyl homoserine lactone hydrolase
MTQPTSQRSPGDKLQFLAMKFHVLVGCLTLGLLTACAVPMTDHAVEPAELGTLSDRGAMIQSLGKPGVVEFEKIVAARWVAPRSGFIDLESEAALSTDLEDVDENLTIFFYVLRHPEHGTFLIDAGIPDDFENLAGFFIRKFFLEQVPFEVVKKTGDWMSETGEKPAGVFLTHMHFDHISGLADLDSSTPIYLGQKEAHNAHWSHIIFKGTNEAVLDGFGALREWSFGEGEDQSADAVIDILGDGSIWAIPASGHTPGSIAYLVNSANGAHLIIGDAAHTRIGWEENIPQFGGPDISIPAQASVVRLKDLVNSAGQIEVHLGHQLTASQAMSSIDSQRRPRQSNIIE